MRLPQVACAYALASIIGTAGPASAQQPAIDDNLRSKIDDIVAPYVNAADFMGVVAVQRDGHTPTSPRMAWRASSSTSHTRDRTSS